MKHSCMLKNVYCTRWKHFGDAPWCYFDRVGSPGMWFFFWPWDGIPVPRDDLGCVSWLAACRPGLARLGLGGLGTRPAVRHFASHLMNNLYVFRSIRWCLRKKRGVRFARLARSRYANLAEYTEAPKCAGRTAGINPFEKKFPNTPPVTNFLRSW